MSTASQDQITNTSPELLQTITDVVGEDNLLNGENGEAFYTDVYRQLEKPIAVARIKSVKDLQKVVSICHQNKTAVTIRGGGASYTDGYSPPVNGVLLLDLSLLNSIVEINETDGYVIVEAGVTWSTLKEALDKRNLRTPFWGPFSGLRATVGGSMSQNTVSHGSGAHGISAQSAMAMDIVLADGSLLQTGSASTGAAPFLRHFGPDLTGLFTGDSGALGIKARITLPLIGQRAAHRTASFAFPDFASMHEAMRLISMERLEDTHFALDGALSQGQIARQDRAGETLKIILSILTSSPSWYEGIKQLIKAGLSGRRSINNSAYMTHYIVEGVNDAEVKGRLFLIREFISKLGSEIPATVPSVVRGMPFAPFFNTLGPSGERWVPLHGILPHSKAVDFHKALEGFFEQRAEEMKQLGIWHGKMFSTIGSSGFLYEIALYWPDEITAYHQEVVPEDYLGQLPKHEKNLQAREYVHQLKNELTELYIQFDAVNFQLGKAYPFSSRLSPESLHLISTIKKGLDPDNCISPGNLGL